jgi:PAS domain S-box-containing protein
MSKKKPVDKRLDKLFTGLKPEKTGSDSKRAPRESTASEKAPPLPVPAPAPLAPEPVLTDTPASRAVVAQPRTQTSTQDISLAFNDGQSTWATVQVFNESEKAQWDPEEEMLVRQVADQLNLALQNAQLFQETQERAEELRVLNEVGQALTATLNIEQITEITYNGISRLFDAKNFYIAFYDPETNEVFFPHNVTESVLDKSITRLAMGQGITSYMIRTQESVLIGDGSDLWLKAHGETPVGEPALSFLGVPLVTGNKVLGAIAIQDYKTPNRYNEHDLRLLTSFASQTAIAIQNAKLFEETRRRVEDTARLNRLVTDLSQTLDLKTNLQTIANEIADITSALHVGIAMIDEAANQLVVIADAPTQGNEGGVGIRLPIKGNPTAEQVISTRKPLFINDTLNNPLTSEIREIMLDRGTQSLFIWPVIVGKELIGTLGIDFADPQYRLSEHDRALIEAILAQIQTSVQNSSLFENTQKSADELRVLFSAMQDVVLVIDKDTRYTRIAPTNPSRLFRPPEQLLGQRMDEILPPETHLPFRHAIQQALETNSVVQIEYQLPVEDQVYWFLANISKLNDNEVFWVARDITERKKSEEALQRRTTYLAISSEIGRIVTSTLDLNTIFKKTVDRISEGFGFYFTGIYNVEETGFNAILKGATGTAGEKLLAAQHSIVVGSQSVIGAVAESGQYKLVDDVAAEPLFRPSPYLPDTRSELAIPLRIGQRTVGVIDIQSKQTDAFTADDVAVLQSLGDQVAVAIDNARSYELSQQLIKDLREVDKLKSQFLANMSHELRTPLNSIIGFSRVILKGIDGPITDMQQQDLTAIYNSGQHLLGLINDVLDLARIEAGKMELNFEEVNLSDMVTSVLSTAKGLVKEKPIQLIQKVPSGMPAIRGDAMRIRQIFINLLSNAAKFTDEGSISVEASIQRSPSGNMEALVKVIDTGPGISAEDQEKLFKAFSQVDGSATRKTGGSGLGLSICANLVQLHGGRIGIQSDANIGSTFWFTIPLFHQSLNTIPLDRKIILAIDDDPQVISLYERYLTPQGYHVVALTNPSLARERILEIKPYAVTLDIMMPDMDGWSILTQLKSDPATRDYPVIVCSILEQANKGFSLGAADYLIKPILEEDLIHAFSRLDKEGTIKEILVIDDDPNDLRLMDKILADQGRYKVTLAEGGKKGWEAIATKVPDAIILDVFMPEIDGFTILEKLNENPSLRNIPVLVVSGGGLTNEQLSQLKEFGKRLLTKASFREGELITTIEQALSRAIL